MTKIFYHHLNEKTLSDIAKYLIKSKNYDELSVLSRSHKSNSFIGLELAIEYLDNEAISIILEQTNFDEPNKKEAALIGISISHFEENLKHEYIKINKVAKYILKIQLDNKLPINKISISIINKIAALDLKELADKFYKEKILTDNDLEYLKKTVDNFSLLLKDIKPHFLSSEDICLDNQFGAILSRTYSDIINREQAYQLYKSVYDSGKYGKAIIDFLNKRIINDDPITLYFNSNGYSSYNVHTNSINVVLNNGFASTEAILAHEITHYVTDRLFKNKGIPFNYPEVDFNKQGFDKLRDKVQNYTLNQISNSKDLKIASNLEKLLLKYDKYSEATKPILLKAAELLNITIPNEYITLFSIELRDFFKFQSLLSLFILDPKKMIEEIKTQKEQKEEQYDDGYEKLTYYLIEYFSKSKDYSEDFNNDIAKIEGKFTTNSSYPVVKEIKEILIKKYYPKIVEGLKLTDVELFILERAADLIQRKDDDFEVESVVRCVELEVQSKFSDISQDSLDSCKKMNEFWDEEILPLMEA